MSGYAHVRNGSKAEKLNGSICFPLCPRKRTSRNVVGMSGWCQERTFPLIAFPTLWIVQGDLVVYVLIGRQMVTPPLPVRGSNVLLCLSKPGASAGVLLLFGNQSFQMAL